MKSLLLIAFMCCSSIAGAQRLLKKKVDPKTGDTTQMTLERKLFNPILKNLAFNEDYKVGWRIVKLMAKGHHEDTLLFFLHINGGASISTKNNDQLLVTFADGHSLSLPVRNALTYQYGGLPAEAPEGSGADTFVTYVLRPDAVREMITAQITAIRVATISGPLDYTVKANSAQEIQNCLSSIAKVE